MRQQAGVASADVAAGNAQPATAGSELNRRLAIQDERRSELKGQLESLAERRALLTMQLANADAETVRDTRAQMKELDARVQRVNSELNAADDAVSRLIGQGAQRPSPMEQLMSTANARAQQATEITPAIAVQGFPSQDDILAPILAAQAIGFVLLGVIVWRAVRRRVGAALSPQDVNRIDQLQRSVDVMAVEIERIAESQRYTAKMLDEQKRALGAGVAEPIDANANEKVTARRGG